MKSKIIFPTVQGYYIAQKPLIAPNYLFVQNHPSPIFSKWNPDKWALKGRGGGWDLRIRIKEVVVNKSSKVVRFQWLFKDWNFLENWLISSTFMTRKMRLSRNQMQDIKFIFLKKKDQNYLDTNNKYFLMIFTAIRHHQWKQHCGNFTWQILEY